MIEFQTGFNIFLGIISGLPNEYGHLKSLVKKPVTGFPDSDAAEE